uniref:Putative vacuolar assembly/sorting n=1 Tax=Ornithodoros turicata TaxID=34597 RepID=A0A2R5L6M1_9ACAR
MSFKAFEIVPATEKVATGITCLECSGTALFVGTACSFVIQYEMEDGMGVRKISHNFLGTKKPVEGLRALSALNRLLAISDSSFLSLNMGNLEAAPQCRVKSVSTFCVNENPTKEDPFCVELCLGKRKQLQLYNLTETKLCHEKDISLPETPLAMAMDGKFLCVALSTQYVLVDTVSGTKQILFPYESNITVPVVKRISKEEFLLNGPSALGMFVTTEGVSQRPPLPWAAPVKALTYSHPYVVCLSDDCLDVYSLFDQQPKQRIPFRGGTYLDNLEGKVLVSGEESVFVLHPIPWETQVQTLLSEKRVTEALELARQSRKDDKELHSFYQRAGFVQFCEWNFEEAQELFLMGQLDVADLLSMYPRLRVSPSPRGIPDTEEMCAGDPELLDKCNQFLISYLEAAVISDAHTRTLVNTALVKLYADTDSDKLLRFVESGGPCDLADCTQFLLQGGRYHAAASLYVAHANHESALQLWLKILKGDLEDSSFPGPSFYVQFLARLSDSQLVLRYVEPALEKDQLMGVKVFTGGNHDDQPDRVLELLHRFPEATVKYLEHLVLEKKIEKEKYHTLLAVLYLERVLEDRCCPERKQLQRLLTTSSCYRVQLLLGKALENELHEECAILYGKLEDHDKALGILVHQLKDYEAAEEYCRRWSRGRDEKYRHRLYQALLTVYIAQQDLLAPAIQLLNSQVADFDAVKVLQVVPQAWSVAMVDQFLAKAVRSSLHCTNMSRVGMALARGETLQAKCSKVFLERKPLVLTEDRVCSICGMTFVEAAFAWCPDGSVVHVHCSGKR